MSLQSETAILLLFVFVSAVSGVQKFTITPDRGTTLTISSSQPKACQVCAGSQRCDTSLTLKDDTRVSVQFTCARPQDVFSVEIVRSIECTTKSCSSHVIQADSSSSPLQDFQRRFTWNIKAQTAFKLDFSKMGLRQISPSERCPDKHTYTLHALQDTGKIAVGKYCTAGTISSAQILNQGSFSVDVPAGQKLQRSQFNVSVGEEIKYLAKISVTLPKSPLSSELLSPNYPDSFPDDDVMQWYFHVPDKHKATIQFLNLTQPQCLKKKTAVEYHSRGRGALVVGLNNAQPVQTMGNFSLTLSNCEMDRRRAGSPGLSLRLKVSASRSSPPVLCKVDPTKTEGLLLRIDNVRPDSDCEMKINSERKKTITVTSTSELSFQDCLPEDVQVTATRVIECRHLKGSKKTPVQLRVPLLPSCLPAPLRMVTWTLRPDQDGTVGITSPTGLLQDLPGQPCVDRDIIKVAEEDGTAIGDFCCQGAKQKVLIHTNVSVTWRSSQTLRSPKDVLSATFESEIAEKYIFRVAPPKNTSILVATPSWQTGMDSQSTVSWIVSVPPKMEAHLMFINISQPKCSNRHTSIKVQRIGRREEDYSRREDEEAESEITVSGNFYLNMSNCMPEKGHFTVITKITLHKTMNLLTIVLSVVASVLAVVILVLVVVCMMVRKKKKQLSEQVGIYNPNGTNFLPGHTGFPKTREDNESHVYASIEDTLVYTHLLKKGAEIGIYREFEAFKSFTEDEIPQKPPAPKGGGDEDTEVGQPVRLPSQQGPPLPNRPPSHVQTLVDNEIYQRKDQSEEESPPNLGPRLEPEGGN